MNAIITAILGALYGYLTSVWSCARMVFSALSPTLMRDCVQLLAVVMIIGIVDNLPSIFARKRKKKRDEDEEYEYIRVRKT